MARTSVTNERGEYVFASVQPGRYDLTVTLAGFAPFTREALEIGVATQLVQDVTMSVGGIAESVTVTGETPLIEDGQRVDRIRHRQSADGSATHAWPQRVHHVRDHAERGPCRRPGVRSHAGSVERIAPVSRWRPAARQQLHHGRCRHDRLHQPWCRQPELRGSRGDESSDRHLRRRNGSYRGRCVQLRAQERLQQLVRFWSLPVASRRGAGRRPFFEDRAGQGCFDRAVPPLGRFSSVVPLPATKRSSGSRPRATTTRARG